MTENTDETDSDQPNRSRNAESADGVPTMAELEAESDSVERLDGNRFIVSTDEQAERESEPPESPSPAPELEHAVEIADDTYAVALAVKTENGTASRRVRSDDVRDAFARTLRWYAGQVEPDLPPDDVLSVLIRQSDLDLDIGD